MKSNQTVISSDGKQIEIGSKVWVNNFSGTPMGEPCEVKLVAVFCLDDPGHVGSWQWLIEHKRDGDEKPSRYRWASVYSSKRQALLADLGQDVVAMREEIKTLKAELKLHRLKASGSYWAWQGDGDDHLESLVCPVIIWPDDLRKMIAPK